MTRFSFSETLVPLRIAKSQIILFVVTQISFLNISETVQVLVFLQSIIDYQVFLPFATAISHLPRIYRDDRALIMLSMKTDKLFASIIQSST